MKGAGTPDLGQVALWNAALLVMSQGVALPTRGRALAELTPDLMPDSDRPAFLAKTIAGPISLQPRDLPLGPLTQSTLDAGALDRLPNALADAVLALAMDRLMAAGGDAVRRAVTALSRCAVAEMAGEERLLLRVDGGWGAVAEVMVQADRAVLSDLLRALFPGMTRGQWPDALAAHVNIACTLRLGAPTLTVARLRGLSVGDLILTTGPQQWLCAPHARFALTHDGTNWTIGEVSMTDDLPAIEPGPAEALGEIGDLPVRLSILLAERTITLSELQGLSKGALLPFAPEKAEAGQSVRLLANGRPIGDGHIVEVDGQPALRIARLFGQ